MAGTTTKTDTMRCHACGKDMARGVRPKEITYHGKSAGIVEQPGWYCDCGESVHLGKDMKVATKAMMRLKAQEEGVLGPDEVEEVRKKLGLTQTLASQILGGGPRSFHKYETGAVLASQPMSNLLRLLRNDPRRLSEIASGQTLKNGLSAGPRK